MIKQIKTHYREVLGTIKLIDIEEKYDIYFSRFFGLFFAKAANKLNLTPTNVSMASLLTGVVGGALLFFQPNLYFVIAATILITLSGILDSADGQLARMTGQSTELGRVIDGLIDTFVFIACYLGGAIPLIESYGIIIIGFGVLAFYVFGMKTATYDFYKTQYLFVFGKAQDAIPFSVKETKKINDKGYSRLIHNLYLIFVDTQLRFTSRSKEMRLKMIHFLKEDGDKFRKKYRHYNKPMMPWWAWICGLNIHRVSLIVFSFIGRFDLYLFISFGYGLVFLPLSYAQFRRDKKLIMEFEKGA